MRPDRETNNAFIYCLAFAAQRFRIRVLFTPAMSNHHHTGIEDPGGNYPAFLELFPQALRQMPERPARPLGELLVVRADQRRAPRRARRRPRQDGLRSDESGHSAMPTPPLAKLCSPASATSSSPLARIGSGASRWPPAPQLQRSVNNAVVSAEPEPDAKYTCIATSSVVRGAEPLAQIGPNLCDVRPPISFPLSVEYPASPQFPADMGVGRPPRRQRRSGSGGPCTIYDPQPVFLLPIEYPHRLNHQPVQFWVHALHINVGPVLLPSSVLLRFFFGFEEFARYRPHPPATW